MIDGSTFALAVLLLVLTIVDGVVTLLLLGAGCEEVNPAMGYLLSQGPLHFLMGKYALTTAGLPFLLIFRHFPLFRSRLRVGHLLPVFVALYLILLGYQIALMNTHVDLTTLDLEDKPRPVSYLPSGPNPAELRTQESGGVEPQDFMPQCVDCKNTLPASSRSWRSGLPSFATTSLPRSLPALS